MRINEYLDGRDLLVLQDGTTLHLVEDNEVNVSILVSRLNWEISRHEECKNSIVLDDIERMEYKTQITTLTNRISKLETKLANKNWQSIPLWIKKLFGIHNLSPIV